MRIANTIGLALTAVLMVGFIMTRPVPAAHTKVECIPIGAAAEVQTEYETIGDWTIRR